MIRRLSLLLLLVAAPLSPAWAQPQPIEAQGPFLHRPSNAVFEQSIARLERRSITRYDDAGADVSATYELAHPQGRVVASVYVYPERGNLTSPAACDRDFSQAREAITARNREVRLISEDIPGPYDGAEPALTRRAAYTAIMHGTERESRTELVLFCHVGGRWMVKYRITGPRTLDPAAIIDDLARLGPWPGRGARPQVAAAEPQK